MADVGDAQRCTATFTVNGVATDPSTVTFMQHKPDGEETSVVYSSTGGTSVVRSSTGVFYNDITWDQAGSWAVRWKGTGTVTAAVESTVVVTTAFTNP